MVLRTWRSRTGNVYYLLSLADLEHSSTCGARLRAYCPIHGSDHQRSLSIDLASGWGRCHNCLATVLVQELDRGGQGSRGDRRAQGPLGFHASQSFQGDRDDAGRAQDRAQGKEKHAGLRAASPSKRASYSHSMANAESKMPHWQQEEREALGTLFPLMRTALATTPLAQQYLVARSLAVEVAQVGGVGYLSRAVVEQAAVSQDARRLLTRWVGRLIFPLSSPEGPGFIGRTLLRWQPGMDENQHKAILEQAGMPRRWLKTNPAGCYGCRDPTIVASTLILVEGCFDRLAVLAAGCAPEAVVALAGTAVNPAWLREMAPQARHIVLALDADAGGTAAMERLVPAFRAGGFSVEQCAPTPVAWGKDWNEQWRRRGAPGLQPLIHRLTPPTLHTAPPPASISGGSSASRARAPPLANTPQPVHPIQSIHRPRFSDVFPKRLKGATCA